MGLLIQTNKEKNIMKNIYFSEAWNNIFHYKKRFKEFLSPEDTENILCLANELFSSSILSVTLGLIYF